MSYISNEICSAISSMKQSVESVYRLSDAESEKILDSVLDIFVYDKSRRWWWESFKHIIVRKEIEDGEGYKHLSTYAPSVTENCWLIAEDDDSKEFLVFRIDFYLIPFVLADSPFFEYYIVDRDMSIIICENHHNEIFVGTNSKLSAVNHSDSTVPLGQH